MTRASHGFTLNELLYVLGFISLALVIEARLFKASMHVIEAAPIPQQEHARLDRMMSAFRQDVWEAGSIDLPDPSTVILADTSGQRRIQWTFGDREAVRSTGQGSPQQHWPIPLAIRADRGGSGVVMLRPAAEAKTQNREMQARRFVSQVLMQSAGAKQ